MAGTWLRPLLSPPPPRGSSARRGLKIAPQRGHPPDTGAGASPAWPCRTRHHGHGPMAPHVPPPSPRHRWGQAASSGAGLRPLPCPPQHPGCPPLPATPTPALHPRFWFWAGPLQPPAPDEGWAIAGLCSPGVGEEHPAPTVGAGSAGTQLPHHRRGWKRQRRFVPSAGWKPARSLLEGSQHSPGSGRQCRSPCQGPAARANGSGDALAKWPAPRGAPGGLRAAQAARHQAWGAPQCWGGVGGCQDPPAAHGSRAPRCAPQHGGTGGGPGAPWACSRAGQGAGCWRWAQSDGSSWAGSSILIDVPKKVARREQEWP